MQTATLSHTSELHDHIYTIIDNWRDGCKEGSEAFLKTVADAGRDGHSVWKDVGGVVLAIGVIVARRYPITGAAITAFDLAYPLIHDAVQLSVDNRNSPEEIYRDFNRGIDNAYNRLMEQLGVGKDGKPRPNLFERDIMASDSWPLIKRWMDSDKPGDDQNWRIRVNKVIRFPFHTLLPGSDINQVAVREATRLRLLKLYWRLHPCAAWVYFREPNPQKPHPIVISVEPHDSFWKNLYKEIRSSDPRFTYCYNQTFSGEIKDWAHIVGQYPKSDFKKRYPQSPTRIGLDHPDRKSIWVPAIQSWITPFFGMASQAEHGQTEEANLPQTSARTENSLDSAPDIIDIGEGGVPTGDPLLPLEVPNLIDWPEEKAVNRLRELGIAYTVDEVLSTEINKIGTVKETFPALGEELDPPAYVSLFIHARREDFVDPPPPPVRSWHSLGNDVTLSPTIARNRDGRLEVFVRKTDGQLYNIYQQTPGGGWSGWNGLGGTLLGRPVVGQNGDGRLEVFVRGSDNALYHKWQLPTGGWSDYESLGGTLVGDPAVVLNSDGRLEVFVRGTDDALWHKWQQPPTGWYPDWHSLGGIVRSDPAVIRNFQGVPIAFMISADRGLWQNWRLPTGAWNGWLPLGGPLDAGITFQGKPVVVDQSDGRLQVFMIGTDGALYTRAQSSPAGDWYNWQNLGGMMRSEVTVIRNFQGVLFAFALSADQGLWQNWQLITGAWNGWLSLGGPLEGIAFTDSPAVAENQDGRLEAFVRGADGTLRHRWQVTPAGNWS